MGTEMRLEDTDWDTKPTDEIARVVTMNATIGVKALRELRNPIAILAFALAWILHRVIVGSWL